MKSVWLIAVVALFTGVPTVAAQTTVAVSVGNRVRVETPDGIVIGNLTSYDGSLVEIALASGPGSRTLLRTEIDRIQVSAGTERRVVQRMLKGGVGTALVAGTFFAVISSANPDDSFFGSPGEAFWFAAQYGAPLGFTIGLLAGLSPSDIWRDADFPAGGQDDRRFAIRPVLGSQVGLVGTWRVPW